jgi:hypothetical protein
MTKFVTAERWTLLSKARKYGSGFDQRRNGSFLFGASFTPMHSRPVTGSRVGMVRMPSDGHGFTSMWLRLR